MIRPTSVQALPGYKLRISYLDGVEGVIDVSEMVSHGVFTALSDAMLFSTVRIGPEGQIAWTEELEICPDAAYLEIGRMAA